jgi:hypothetical protein
MVCAGESTCDDRCYGEDGSNAQPVRKNIFCGAMKNEETCVGTLKDGYVRNVPLPRVPQIQSASPMTSRETIATKAGIPLPGYLHVPSWIPTLPKLGSILGFSQRLL